MERETPANTRAVRPSAPTRTLADRKRSFASALISNAPQTLLFATVLSNSGRYGVARAGLWMLAVFLGIVAIAVLDWRLRKRSVSAPIRFIAPAVFLVVGFALMPRVLGVPVPQLVIVILAVLCFSGGLTLLGLGFVRAIRTPPACVRCGYERGEAAAIPDRCPECSSLWTRPGGIVELRTQRNPRLLAAGAAALLLSMTLYAGNLFSFSFASGAWPTTALLIQLETAQLFPDGAWAELRARTLSPEQQTELARVLLNRCLRGDMLSTPASAWLDTQIAQNTLPPDVAERYFAEMLDVVLIAPRTARRGEPVSLRLQGGRRGHSTSYRAAGAFAGFFLGDAQPQARPSLLIPDHEFSEHLPDHQPQLTFTPESAGPLRVRAPLWVIVCGGNTWNVPIAWNDDGTPVLPPGTVWSKRLDLEATLDIRP